MNLDKADRGVIARTARHPERKGTRKEKALEKEWGTSQQITLGDRHPSQDPTRRAGYAHSTIQECGFATASLAEGGTGPVAVVAHCVGNPEAAMLGAVVEEYTKDSKEEDGEEEVATEVVEATTPPTRITLEIEPTTSIAAPDTTRGVAVEDPTGEPAAGKAIGIN